MHIGASRLCFRTCFAGIRGALAGLGQANDVAFADRALLEVNEPLLKAVDVQNVLAHRNFHHFFLLFKVLETESALLLVGHVSKFSFAACVDCAELDSVHNFEVNANDRLCVFVGFVIVEFSVAIADLVVAGHVCIALFVLSQEKADDFDEHNEDEEKDGPRYQDHYHSLD